MEAVNLSCGFQSHVCYGLGKYVFSSSPLIIDFVFVDVIPQTRKLNIVNRSKSLTDVGSS